MKKRQIRMGAILSMAILALVGILPVGVNGEEKGFSDITKDYWDYKSIVWATEQGIVDGYPDGSFKPEKSVSQPEFIAMLVRAYLNKEQLPEGDSSFWAAPYIKLAFNMGWGGSIIVPPSSKLSNDSSGSEFNINESRNYVAKLITNANGRNYNYNDSILFLLDSGLAEGKADKSIEGFKGNDSLTRAEAVTFIRNLKAKQSVLYPSPVMESAYNPATLKVSPFELYPLTIDQPQDPIHLRYSNVTFKAPTVGYTLVHEPFYTLEGVVTDSVGNDLTVVVEYWDSGNFKPVATVKAPMTNGKFSAKTDLQKTGVYRITVKSEFEQNGKKLDNKITLTSFYVEYKTST